MWNSRERSDERGGLARGNLSGSTGGKDKGPKRNLLNLEKGYLEDHSRDPQGGNWVMEYLEDRSRDPQGGNWVMEYLEDRSRNPQGGNWVMEYLGDRSRDPLS